MPRAYRSCAGVLSAGFLCVGSLSLGTIVTARPALAEPLSDAIGGLLGAPAPSSNAAKAKPAPIPAKPAQAKSPALKAVPAPVPAQSAKAAPAASGSENAVKPAPAKPAVGAPGPAAAKLPAAAHPVPAGTAAVAPAPAPAKVEPAGPAIAVTDPTVTVDSDDPELKAAPDVKAGSAKDKRPARKLFGAAKSPAALSARAIGGYAKGCLAGGKALAIDGPEWQAMRLSRNRNWGHPKLVALLERYTKELREKESWPGLLIGDMSQPRGGPMLTGHKSHQIGLDADIWFRPMPEKRFTKAERETAAPILLARDNGTEVIAENWNEGYMRIVRRAAKYPEVERIFVHPAIKKAFCAAAGEDRSWLRKVRPMWGHNYHFHVRMGCVSGSPTCVPQKAVDAEGDGCGKEIEEWLKLVSKPAKPQPKPTVPAPPSKPKVPLLLKDLPSECTDVIAAADPKPTPAKAAAAEGAAPAAAPPPGNKSAAPASGNAKEAARQ